MARKSAESIGFSTWIITIVVAVLLAISPQSFKDGLSSIVRDSLFGPFVWIDKQYDILRDNFSRYLKLYSELGKTKMELQVLREAKVENERLRKLLDFQQRSDFRLILCEIIGANPPHFPSELIIARSSLEDISKNCPVVSPEGLVGQVSSISKGTAIVKTILNPSIRISAIDQRSRVKGIVYSKDGRTLIFAQVPKDEDVIAGDRIVTSGLGGIYPKGILIGKVVSALNPPETMFKRIIVEPAVEMDKLEEVFVVVGLRAQETPEDTVSAAKIKSH